MPDDFDFSQPRGSRTTRSVEQPLITILIMVLSAVFTAAFWYSADNHGSSWYNVGQLGLTPSDQIWSGKYWALITAIFPHLNIVHILFNMMWTWRLGAAIEAELNPLAYLGFIIGAAVVGSGAQIALTGDNGIGMSGVVYAMFGLMWAGRGRSAVWRSLANRENMNLFIGWGVLCIITTYTGIMRIGNGAHFGGLAFGLCVGYLWLAPRKRPVFYAPLALLTIITIMSVTWLPWSSSWQWWKGNSDYSVHKYSSAITHYQVALRLGGEPVPLLTNLLNASDMALEAATDRKDTPEIARLSTILHDCETRLTQLKPADQNSPEPASSGSDFLSPESLRRNKK